MLPGARQQAAQTMARPVQRATPPMYFFCLGSAKSGTTWLYHYLRAHPQCHVRGYKELHFFDMIENARYQQSPAPINSRLAALDASVARREVALSKAKTANRARLASELLDAKDYRHAVATCQRDPNAYFKYMMAGLKKEQMVADITPDYAHLSPDTLRMMVGVANETRFLFLMRDPVARFWSHVRMDAKGSLPEGADFAAHAKAVLAEAMKGDKGTQNVPMGHSQYERTLRKMQEALPEDRRLVMFYEDLMTPLGLRRLCNFLNIKPLLTEFERPVRAGKKAELSVEETAALRRLLRPEYEYVAAHFPDLPDAWKASMAEGFA